MSDSPSPTPSPTPTSTPGASDAAPAVEALQTVLAGEHAAVFVYGDLGARASRASERPLYDALTAAYAVHRRRRDDTMAALVALKAEPVAAEAAYDLPLDPVSPDVLRRRARELEAACARTYAYAVARTSGDARARAVQALLDAAVREVGFGAAPDRLPGL